MSEDDLRDAERAWRTLVDMAITEALIFTGIMVVFFILFVAASR